MSKTISYHLILLGGTGARCGEIFLHMCANGYFRGKSVHILHFDSDTYNGNSDSLRNAVETYQACRKQYFIEASPVPCFFRPSVEYEQYNPAEGMTTLLNLAREGRQDIETLRGAEKLAQALFSEDEYNLCVTEGFFARPSVGAAMFAARVGELLAPLQDKIERELRASNDVRIFLIGSVFGGTGAASLPTISQYLRTKLFRESDDKNIRERLKIGCCMILPYFSFLREHTKEDGTKEQVEIEADKFTLKTKSAIQYYKDLEALSKENIFDALYILGHDGHDIRGKYSIAGSEQKNLPHIVEFYAAMSGVTFFENQENCEGHFFAAVSKNKIDWTQMYKPSVCFFNFFVMMRFSLMMESLILEELFKRPAPTGAWKQREKAEQIPWYYDFLDGKSPGLIGETLSSQLSSIHNYCKQYISWFATLIIADIKKKENPQALKREHMQKTGDTWEEEDELVNYLQLFDEEILLRQYENILIESGGIRKSIESDEDSDDVTSKSTLEKEMKKRWKQNINYIRKHSSQIAGGAAADFEEKEVSFSNIWDRLNSMGLNLMNEDEQAFKNISQSTSNTTAEGVRNLVNAVFIACMF